MSPRGARAPERLPERVLEVVRRERLWAPGAPVAVACSGGLDSSALLLALHETRAAHGAALRVLSVDHGLRPAAAAEAAAVGALAASLGLPFTLLRLGLSPGPDLAARARAARRAALVEAAGAGAPVATGHHADDQAETVLQRLFSGAGARGLAGLRPAAGPFVHPLIEEERADLRAFAALRGLGWCEDPSNPASQRGRLRALLAATLGRGPVRALARSARLLAQDDALLDLLAANALAELTAADPSRLPMNGLRALHPALGARALRAFLGPPLPGAAALDGVLRWQGGGQRLRLPDGGLLVHRGGALERWSPGAGPDPDRG